MNQILKHVFSTSAHLNAAERIAWTYKTTIISFLDKTHRNPEDIQRLETYVDYKKPELEEFGVVEVMARGKFHPRRPEDSDDLDDRLTVHLINAQGIPVKSVHLSEDGTEASIVDVPEHQRPKLAARFAASKAAAAAPTAAGAGASGSKGGKK